MAKLNNINFQSIALNIFISIFFSVLSTMVFTILYNKFYHKSIATINLDEIISNHIVQIKDKTLDDSQLIAVSEEFSKKLDFILHEIEKKDNVILLTSPAVISTNVPSYNDSVLFYLNQIGFYQNVS